jgi:hypothetical protein
MLLLILGPPAVGKMTVGRAVADRSAFRLFHNHHSIEMLLDVFDHGTPPYTTLNTEIRRRVVEEAAAAGTDLVFTFVMGMDEQGEADYLERLTAPYGDRVALVELVADLDTRLVRNRTEHRLAEKKSKRGRRVVGHQRPRARGRVPDDVRARPGRARRPAGRALAAPGHRQHRPVGGRDGRPHPDLAGRHLRTSRTVKRAQDVHHVLS